MHLIDFVSETAEGKRLRIQGLLGVMKTPKSLQDISAFVVAEFLIDARKDQANEHNSDPLNGEIGVQKPLFPKKLVQRILPYILYLRHSRDQHVQFSDLNVLISGHILTDIRLCYTKMYLSDFEKLVEVLSRHAEVVTVLVVRDNKIVPDNPVVRISKRLADVEQVVQPISSLENFLPLAKNLQQLDTDVPLNPTCLENLTHLEDLCFCPSEAAAFYGETILNILKACPNLVNFPVDIAMAMELFLQEDSPEFVPKFRLQKTVLECMDMGGFTCVLYGERGVNILKTTAIMCPDLKELYVRTNDQYIFDAISYFPSVEHLHVLQHCGPSEMYVSDSPPEVLHDMGHKMKCLKLENIHEMDFGLIAEHFPHLTKLKVEFWHEVSSPEFFPEEPLKNLETLHLNGQECTAETLLLLLSSCRRLQELVLYKINSLDDDLLLSILKINPLERLLWCHITDCRLKKQGLVMFLESCKDLQTLIFSSSLLSDEEYASVLSSIRPDIFTPPSMFKYWKEAQCFSTTVPFSKFCPTVQFSNYPQED